MSFQSFSLCTEVLRRSRAGVNFLIAAERRAYLDAILPTMRDWRGDYPNLRHIFHPDEIELLLFESVTHENNEHEFIKFAALSGYRDEKVVYGDDGRPTSRRPTPVHAASKRHHNFVMVRDLFEIYDRRDINYIDEAGLSHFHVACKTNLWFVVRSYLDRGLEHVNILEPESVCPPLHLALNRKYDTLIQLLIERGADPNLANGEMFTPLHVVCGTEYADDESSKIASLLFEQNAGKVSAVQPDPRDLQGNTPLHMALSWDKKKTAKLLLNEGADPNAASNDGRTALHAICKSGRWNHKLIRLLYKYSKHEIRLEVRDESGRTPLQWAVANLATESVRELLERGARVDTFTFPTEDYFATTFERRPSGTKLEEVAGVLTILESLEAAGYLVQRVDALAVLNFFAKQDFYQPAPDLGYIWSSCEKFENEAQWPIFKTASHYVPLPLYDVAQIEPAEAARRFRYKEYFEFATWAPGLSALTPEHRDHCDQFLCESLINRFCTYWEYVTVRIMAQIRADLERNREIRGNEWIHEDEW
uniref:Uncharacterized protein n=1 Tax=Trichogramma kaykai TaxID=54128 RepID=A0ABD2XE36_9HYME